MRIVNCPKGGRVPEGYCRYSCLNYHGKAQIQKWCPLRTSKGGLSKEATSLDSLRASGARV